MEEKEVVVEETKKTKKASPAKTERTWKEIFKANYEGTSEEAKSLEPFIKHTYKGDPYIPWAVMERLTYMCDENAKFTNIANANGGLVHSDAMINHQKSLQKDIIVQETEATMFSHFVKVALEFMGKVFIEDYPIQEKDYSSVKSFDQTLVNRALQRAKAKVAARATGLALKLYEGFDLQFDENIIDRKPTLSAKEEVKVVEKSVEKKVEEKVKLTEEQKVQNIVDGGETEAYLNGERTFTTQEVKEEPKAPVETATVAELDKAVADADVLDLVKIIKETEIDAMNKVLQRVNVSIMKKYGFVLSTLDTDTALIEKISKFPNVAQFKKTILNLLG